MSAEPNPATEIADAVLAWMIEREMLDAGNEYRAADVLAVFNDIVSDGAEPGWRPIETAPKGTMNTILIFGDEGTELVWWSERAKRWLSLDGKDSYNEKPSHWMPLPAPPAQER